jgi:hypothetical protein
MAEIFGAPRPETERLSLYRTDARRGGGFDAADPDSHGEEVASALSPFSSESLRCRLETIMKYSCVAIVALLSLSSAAWAETGTNPPPASRQAIAQADALGMSNNPATGYRRNANNCAPDLARAVWGPREALLGYACYDNPNGP